MFFAVNLGQTWRRLGEVFIAMLGTSAEGRKPQGFPGCCREGMMWQPE